METRAQCQISAGISSILGTLFYNIAIHRLQQRQVSQLETAPRHIDRYVRMQLIALSAAPTRDRDWILGLLIERQAEWAEHTNEIVNALLNQSTADNEILRAKATRQVKLRTGPA